jgi:putative zinc finger/helix-turn-helix YgiT family protein
MMTMMRQCPNCRIGRLARRAVERERHVAGHVFRTQLPGWVCGACGTAYFDDAVVAQFDLLVAARLAEAGVRSAEALAFMRKVTGMDSTEFADLIAVPRRTVAAWERGKRPIDRATYALIRQLISERLRGLTLTADYLRTLRRPRKLPKTVRVSVSRAA